MMTLLSNHNLHDHHGWLQYIILIIIIINIKFTYHRNDVDFVAQSFHELNIELFEFVAVGRDKVEAGVHPGDDDDYHAGCGGRGD